jgi:predicted RNA binding protein YcfA (HicA-like mRNA interferase family)
MNERLPALTAREVIRVLERAGFVVSRTRGTMRGIIAQAGMTVAEFLSFL